MEEGLSFMRIVCQVIDCWCAVTIPPWASEMLFDSRQADIVMTCAEGPEAEGQEATAFSKRQFHWEHVTTFAASLIDAWFGRCPRKRSERLRERIRFWAKAFLYKFWDLTRPNASREMYQGSWRWRLALPGSSKVGPNDTSPTSRSEGPAFRICMMGNWCVWLWLMMFDLY